MTTKAYLLFLVRAQGVTGAEASLKHHVLVVEVRELKPDHEKSMFEFLQALTMDNESASRVEVHPVSTVDRLEIYSYCATSHNIRCLGAMAAT